MSMADIQAATIAMNALLSRYSTLVAEVEAKNAKVEATLASLRGKLISPTTLRYNEATIYSKTSLNLAPDPTDPTKSVWGEIIPPSNSSFQTNAAFTWLASVTFASVVSIAGGISENPKYTNDKSRTYVEFIVAPIGISNTLINQLLIEQNKTPLLAGVSSAYALGAELPVLMAPNISTLNRLFARFVNFTTVDPSIPNGTPPQPISYGGNPSFAVQTVNLYRG